MNYLTEKDPVSIEPTGVFISEKSGKYVPDYTRHNRKL